MIRDPRQFDMDYKLETVDPLAPRPYLQTSGRVKPGDGALELEAQVITSRRGKLACADLTFERRDIVDLCTAAMSVAEVAARLGLHLGVARVLIGDAVSLGHLDLLRPRAGMSRDPETLERVIRGLKAIS